VRQRGERVIPIVGVRTLNQLHDVLGSLDLKLSADNLSQLDGVSAIELGFPYTLLQSPLGQLVYGDVEPKIDLPPTAPFRWAAPPAVVLSTPPSAPS
jgi:hypothetical protein